MEKQFDRVLKGMEAMWKKAKKEAEANPGGSVDDGKYEAKLVKAELGESQSGRIQIVYHYTITEGEFAGRRLTEFQGLDTEIGLSYFARRLLLFGYDLEDISMGEINEVLAELVADQPLVQLTVKTRGEYQNVYVDRVLESVTTDIEDEDDEPSYKEEEEVEEEPKVKAKEKTLVEPVKPKTKVKTKPEPEPESENDEDEDEDEEDDGEDFLIEEGDEVEYTHRGKEYTGVVLRVLSDKLKVQPDGVNSIHTVHVNDATLV